MDAPSLRQFTLDLAMNRTKKALIIDQRFNGGGGIDQELLGILVGQKYQYTRGRDAGLDVPRPLETFYGPMVVMQNERSASDAEMFPQGFKDLKLGKVVGVPTMGAVIGDRIVHAGGRLQHPHARFRRLDRARREHGELRRQARCLHRQHAGGLRQGARRPDREGGRSPEGRDRRPEEVGFGKYRRVTPRQAVADMVWPAASVHCRYLQNVTRTATPRYVGARMGITAIRAAEGDVVALYTLTFLPGISASMATPIPVPIPP